MTVIDDAPALPTVIRRAQLETAVQTAFEKLMDDADTAAEHRELTSYGLLHAQAANLIGIRTPACGELARCTCMKCYCDAIFDAAKARTYLDGSVEVVQCETCAGEHRGTGNE
ncbi:hypothetical protein [Streptomyces sp. Wb2n-11]|uniref:hypothetical protein n=1 Tax=Streptomyces sp. Wb2n-11 TaxID=1030533 RepID=UPI000B0E7464|nr:hypothetical protein [Streptomyces sp. Wb2n-11]